MIEATLKKLQPLLLEADRWFLFAVYALAGIGLVLLYSADFAQGFDAHFTKQVAMVGISTILLIMIALMPGNIYYNWAYVLYGISLLFLLMVLFWGVETYGAKRWVYVLGEKVQPSEPAKIALILVIARILSNRSYPFHWGRIALKVGLFSAIPFTMVLIQPDLGTSTVFAVIPVVMLAWFGLPLTYFAGMFCMGASLFFLAAPWVLVPVIMLILLWMKHNGSKFISIFLLAILCAGSAYLGPTAWSHVKPYQKQRLTSFLEPEKVSSGAGYQVIQSRVAIGSGGLIGKGFKEGTQTQLRFLPEQHTDFIFSIAGEEFGFFGVTSILGLLFLFAYRGYRIAANSQVTFLSMIAVGCTTLVIYHSIINIGMATGVMPVTGLPLPLVSYGRTFLVTIMVASGFVVSASIHRKRL